MVNKPLPLPLVKRLKSLVEKNQNKRGTKERVYRFLGNLKNIDHRKGDRYRPPKNTEVWGFRVRQMNVSRNYPGVKLVIKRDHQESALHSINTMKELVRKHNKKFSPKDYILKEPIAYAIGKKFIAMAKTDKPTLNELTELQTTRAKKMFKKLNQKLNITLSMLEELTARVTENSGIADRNIILLGFRGKKVILMPLIDIH